MLESDLEFPVVRNDLQLFTWEPDSDGSEQWVIGDGLRNQFYVVSREVLEIFKRLHLRDVDKIVQDVSVTTSMRVTAQNIAAVVQFVNQNSLTVVTTAQDIARISAPPKRVEPWWQVLIHRYIMFRVTLLYPDKFLDATKRYVSVFFSRAFFLVTGFVGVLGLALTLRNWSAFEHEINGLWSISGVVGLFTTLVFVKLIHEFAHAYTAKRYGVRVPVMGVTFIVLFPLPFTNTTESWKLYSHRQRLHIAAAGIVAEMVLAFWATFLWQIVPDGPVQTATFMIATTTWISSLLVNASPFMRFDGYFLLMDYLRLPNMHARSGALAKWWMREFLFGWGHPAPEYFPRRQRNFLIAFAYVTWVYRLLVFITIALLVYHFFIKAVGVLMFLVEIFYFIMRPILMEIQNWTKTDGGILKTRRSKVTLSALTLACAALFIPFPRSSAVPAIYLPYEEQSLFAPEPGKIASLDVDRGDRVGTGQRVATIASEELSHEREIAQIRADVAARTVQVSGLLRGGNQPVGGRDETWRAAVSRLRDAQQRLETLAVVAPAPGEIVDLSPQVQVGATVAQGDFLGVLRLTSKRELHAYVSEELASELSVGDRLPFFFDGTPFRRHYAEIVYISAIAVRDLPYPELSSAFGGALPSFSTEYGLEFDQPMFAVQLSTEQAIPVEVRTLATLFAQGDRESIAAGLFRRGANLFLREFAG